LRSGALRQSPGPCNPIGRIKFNMPNPFSVYLHDTPAKSLFSLESRAFSHGCIRIERPVDLALYLLRNQPDWNPTSLNAAIGTENEHVIRLARPEPVYVLYWTAWAADDGHVEFHRDVYSRDGQLAKALRQ
jgi:L,D-transpeptidase YcbB